MKGIVKIGIVCLVRKTFEWETAWKDFQGRFAHLKNIENVEWVLINRPVIEIPDADAAAAQLQSECVDGIIITSGTFHLGHLALILAQKVRKPIYLWALPEPPYNGGKIRYNSACGLNLNASNLYKAGIQNFHHSISEAPDSDWIDAVRMVRAMDGARIGLVGARAQGFFNLAVDELPHFSDTGSMIEYFLLEDMYRQPADEAAVAARRAQFQKIFDHSEMSSEQMDKISRLAVSAKTFVETNNLSALAIRCWPEYAREFGVSPCAAMSLLASEGYLMACEGDVQLALTMLAVRAAGGETPYSADFSQVDFADNSALLWHCGVAPCNLIHGKCTPSLDTYFAGGKGVTVGFVMKEGPFNVFRIDTALGKTRIFSETGDAVFMEKLLKGTYAKGKFHKPVKDVFDTIVQKGFAHHVAMVYGDFQGPFKLLARIKGWEMITA